jgi:hypothetical protein
MARLSLLAMKWLARTSTKLFERASMFGGRAYASFEACGR